MENSKVAATQNYDVTVIYNLARYQDLDAQLTAEAERFGGVPGDSGTDLKTRDRDIVFHFANQGAAGDAVAALEKILA